MSRLLYNESSMEKAPISPERKGGCPRKIPSRI
jgi:hypothetical protein